MGLRVLHLIDSGGLYGAERMLLTLVQEQLRQGLEPTILSAGEAAIEEKAIEAEARRLGLPVVQWRMKPGLNLREARKIIHWAVRHNTQIFHAHGYKFNILLGGWPKKLRGGIPLVSTLHGYVKASPWTRIGLYEVLDRIALRQVDRVVLVDKSMRTLMPQSIAQSGRCIWVPNGIEELPPKPDSLPIEVEDFVGSHKATFAVVGRFSEEKGLDRLVLAVANSSGRLDDVGFVLIGDGPVRAKLQRQIADAGLERQFLMPGYFSNVAAMLPHFHGLLMPSRTEGLPITILEALRARLPIVATAVGSLPSILGPLSSARLLQPSANPDELIAAIEEFATDGPDDAARARGFELFARSYTASRMAALYLEVYQQLFCRHEQDLNSAASGGSA